MLHIFQPSIERVARFPFRLLTSYWPFLNPQSTNKHLQICTSIRTLYIETPVCLAAVDTILSIKYLSLPFGTLEPSRFRSQWSQQGCFETAATHKPKIYNNIFPSYRRTICSTSLKLFARLQPFPPSFAAFTAFSAFALHPFESLGLVL